MPRTQVTYIISIKTRRGNLLNGQSLNMPYHQTVVNLATAKMDKVKIHSTYIRITAKRSNLSSAQSIIEDQRNTLHIQIIKQTVLYYASNLTKAGIKEIKIESYVGGQLHESKRFSYKLEDEPLRNLHWRDQWNFATNDLINYIKNDFESYGVILSHWLSGVSADNTYTKFESLWCCFERLSFKCYHGSNAHPRDKETLKVIREFIRKHHIFLDKSCNFVHKMTDKDLREKFTWKLMIYNDFKRGGRMESYNLYKDEFVLPYQDSRVVKMLRDTLVYREKDIQNYNPLYNDILSHLNHYMSQNICKDVDILAILCGTFANYMRNKIFHGELLCPSISLSYSFEDKIITSLNHILEIVDFELIKCYSNL